MFEQYRLAIYGAVIVAAILAVIAYGSHKYNTGYDAAETKYKLEISQANEKAQSDLNAAEARYRDAEQKQAADFNALAETYDQKMKDAEHEKNDAIDRDLAHGLYASVTTCEGYPAGVSETSAYTSGATKIYRARLSNATDKDLRELAADANKCAEAYNTAHDALEKERK